MMRIFQPHYLLWDRHQIQDLPAAVWLYTQDCVCVGMLDFLDVIKRLDSKSGRMYDHRKSMENFLLDRAQWKEYGWGRQREENMRGRLRLSTIRGRQEGNLHMFACPRKRGDYVIGIHSCPCIIVHAPIHKVSWKILTLVQQPCSHF